MSSTDSSETEDDLIFFKTFQHQIKITLKSKRINPFIAQVKEFNFKMEDSRVIFKRCPETVFPTDTEDQKESTYMTFIKNIRTIEVHKMPEKK